MKSLSVFVVSHDPQLLARVPSLPYLRNILLSELDIPERFKGDSLSENRIFLSQDAMKVETDFVGLVSARFEEREPNGPGFLGLLDLVQSMSDRECWSPVVRNVNTSKEASFWIAAQDGIHPGMAGILGLCEERLFPESAPVTGVVFTGNQFIVPREHWIRLVKLWRLGLSEVEKEYGLVPPFSYRCFNCGTKKPNGYWRYSPARHLGFIGERLTALIMTRSGLSPALGKGGLKIEDNCLSRAVPKTLSRSMKALLPRIWVISRLPRRLKCDICR